MKDELNYSLRLRFFGQYLNSCDCGDHGEDFRVPWDSRSMYSLLEAKQEQAFLYLRAIGQLSDDESLELARLAGYSSLKGTGLINEIENDFALIELEAWDYLRSIGIALPFMGHSIESLVSAGWIKLTNPPA
jgi:hypothetical protein